MGGVGGDTAQYYYKAELLQVGILFAWEILLLKKLEIEKTKPT